mmetsp:Transcript_79032/g.156549  ORF Transcript_79032/g.156549 Transcript_79032/m.156549 type:complete len:334 (+) Transcript_79032:170-1171(+)
MLCSIASPQRSARASTLRCTASCTACLFRNATSSSESGAAAVVFSWSSRTALSATGAQRSCGNRGQTRAQMPHRRSGQSAPSPSVEKSKSAESPGSSQVRHRSAPAVPEPWKRWDGAGFGSRKASMIPVRSRSKSGFSVTSLSVNGSPELLRLRVAFRSTCQPTRTPAIWATPSSMKPITWSLPRFTEKRRTSPPTRCLGPYCTRASGSKVTAVDEQLFVNTSITSDIANNASFRRRCSVSTLWKAASSSSPASAPSKDNTSLANSSCDGPLNVAAKSRNQPFFTPCCCAGPSSWKPSMQMGIIGESLCRAKLEISSPTVHMIGPSSSASILF